METAAEITPTAVVSLQRLAYAIRRRESELFAAGAGLAALHALNVAAWIPLALLAALAIVYRSLPAPLRAAVAGVLAPLAIFGGFLHVLHVRWDGAGRGDVTGLLLFPAAALLLASACAALFARPKRGAVARVGRALMTVAVAAALAIFAVVPIASAMWLTGKPREPLTTSLGLPHREVAFHAADGTRLSGWYVPSRNGAAVVLVHGGGGDRTGTVRHARLLARHGYGVLLYDERGRGRSEGQTNGMGWDWHHDVRAAVDWLRVHGIHRVGVLGLSTGAEAVITAAAGDPRIDAVVAEGVIGRSDADTRELHDWSASAYWWVAFRAIGVQTQDSAPPPLTEGLRRIAPRPVLLITAERDAAESDAAPAYRRAAGPTATFWRAPTTHTHALESFPGTYEHRVIGFLDRALVSNATTM
jgi:alpha-beta hydrolase superfamily lysophospholipase